MNGINLTTHRWCELHTIPSYFKTECASTNQWAKTDFSGSAPLTVFVTDHQSQGRGRGSRTWTNAKPGATLLSTWCLPVQDTPQPIFSVRCGLLLWEALVAVWPTIPWALKAPNDIYVGLGKFAGILVEVDQQGKQSNVFIGIGANIFESPTTIDQETFTLSSQLEVSEEAWGAFCDHFTRGLLEMRKDAHRQLLTPRDINSLEIALQQHSQNMVKAVLPDGGLILKNNDRIHWNEL